MKSFFTFLLIVFTCITASAERITEQQALQKAQEFMKGKQFVQGNKARRVSPFGQNGLSQGYYIFNVENNGGFVIVAGDDCMPEVLGYSFKGSFDNQDIPDNVQWLLDYYDRIAKSMSNTSASRSRGVERATRAERAEVIPFIRTVWSQRSPYNDQCPEIDGTKCLTGCVATAMAQVINYFRWPKDEIKGVAGYTTRNSKINMPELPSTTFDWNKMTNDDIARLMRYCGQSVEMDYGTISSGAFSSSVAPALIKTFNYREDAKEIARKSYSDEEWETLMYGEVSGGRPVIYSGHSGESGHEFILHGYRDGLFRVNWGWGGLYDGYYALTNLQPDDDNYSENQSAVIGIIPLNGEVPEPIALETKSFHVEEAGTLSKYIPESDKYNIVELTLSGEINGTDILLLRDMMGYKSEGCLRKLDLSKVRIVEGGDAYYSSRKTANDKIGMYMFLSCSALEKIVLPETILSIGSYAFWNTNFTEIIIPKSVTSVGSIFGGSNIKSVKVEDGNTVFDSRDNCNAIIESATNKLVCGSKGTYIPSSVSIIDESAFSNCSLDSIEIPESIKSIGNNAFYSSNLRKVISHIKEPFEISSGVFKGNDGAVLYVPYGTKSVYMSTSGWDVFNKVMLLAPEKNDNLQSSAGIFIYKSDKCPVGLGKSTEFPVCIINEGVDDIKSIDYTISLDSRLTEKHLDITSITSLATQEVKLFLDADTEIGSKNVILRITKVNGVDNQSKYNSVELTLVTMSKTPKRRAVVEEHTGTWCPWCPRGIIGLEMIEKEFHDDVINIAVHYDDPMELPDYRWPSTGSFPSCKVNRGEKIDPYFGSSKDPFGIKRDIEEILSEYVPIGIEVEAEWANDSKTAINIKTTTTSLEDVDNSPYQIGYVLLEDGLIGWGQVNGYYGRSDDYFVNAPDLKILSAMSGYNMSYDHVPVAAWDTYYGMSGTLPENLKIGESYAYTYMADITGNTHIQNKEHLSVVALILDKKTGKIVNGAKVNLQPFSVLAKAYVTLSENNSILTFYYDDQKDARKGLDVKFNSWKMAKETIIRVVFDASFAKYDAITSTESWFDGCENLTAITDISNLKTDNVTNMEWMFSGCSSLTSLDVSGFKTDNVTNMGYMFYGCSNLSSLDVSGFKTDNVTGMYGMFFGCSNLSSLDVSGFKTDNVTSMYGMFDGCSNLSSLDVSGFKTDNVKSMGAMFYGCSNLTSLDVSGFKTDNVSRMESMFHGCSNLSSLDVSGFKTDNVTNMESMFYGCSNLSSLDVSGFKTDNVTNMESMFSGCSSLTSLDVSGFKTDKVTSMFSMFSGCSNLSSLDVSGFKTDNVTTLKRMFYGCSNLSSLDVSGFKTDNVKNMAGMFFGCSNLTSLDVSGFKTDNVTNMYEMFRSCSKLETIYAGSEWNTAKVTSSDYMFYGCKKLVGGSGTRYDSNHVGQNYAHIDGGPDNPGYFTSVSDKKAFVYRYKGETIGDNATVIIQAEEDSFGFGEMNCETNPSSNPKNGLILVSMNGNQEGHAKLEILSNTLDPGMIQWCMGGECVPMLKETSLEKSFKTDSEGIAQVLFDATNIKSVGSLEAKLTATIGSDTRTVNIKFVCDKTNGISIIYSDEDAVWYDMNGTRFENAPTRKGVYIKNGKKVVR